MLKFFLKIIYVSMLFVIGLCMIFVGRGYAVNGEDDHRPDLQILDFHNITPGEDAEYRQGTILEFQMTIRNQLYNLSGPLENVQVRLYSNAWGWVNDVVIERLEYESVITVPMDSSNARTGFVTFNAAVDPNHEIEERSEFNNQSVTLRGISIRRRLRPDLAVEQVRSDPEHPQMGESFTLIARVMNEGRAQASPFLIKARVDNEEYVEQEVEESLDIGASIDIRFPDISVVDDTYHILSARVDPDSELVDSDTSNNRGTYRLETPLPDLLIENLNVYPRDPEIGDPVEVRSVQVSNHGQNSSGPFTVRFMDQHRTMALVRVEEGLRPGQSRVIRCDNGRVVFGEGVVPGLGDGHHYLRAIIELEEGVLDVDMSNHSVYVDLGPAAYEPDLIVADIQNVTPFVESPYYLSDMLQFDVTVRDLNYRSERDVVDTVNVSIYCGSRQAHLGIIREFREETTVRVNVELADADIGEHNVRGQVDTRSLRETNENNNRFQIEDPIQIVDRIRPPEERPPQLAGLPDLVITDVVNVTEGSESPYTKGDWLEFDVTVRNENYRQGEFLRRVPVQLSFGRATLFGGRILRLEEEATVRVGVNTRDDEVEPGDKEIRVTVNRDRGIEEFFYGNNEFQMDDTIQLLPRGADTGRPDMVIESLAVDPPCPRRGDIVIPILRLRNDGEQDTGQFGVLVTDKSRNRRPSPAGESELFRYRRNMLDVANIEPGENVEMRMNEFPIIARSFEEGHVIEASADAFEYITESNENNNFRRITLDIPDVDEENPTHDLLIFQISQHSEGFSRDMFYEVEPEDTLQLKVWIADNDVLQGSFAARVIENVEVSLQIGEEWVRTQNITVRDARAEVIFDILADELGEGDYSVRAFIDSRDQIDESNENNNIYENNYGVRVLREGEAVRRMLPRPDIVLEALSVDPSEPQRGDSMIPVVRLRNDGEEDTGRFGVLITDKSLNTLPRPEGESELFRYHRTSLDVENIEPGENIEVRGDGFRMIARALRRGHVIEAKADHNENIFESDENNNFRQITLDIPPVDQENPTHDLLIVRISRFPIHYSRKGFFEAEHGDTLQLSIRILDNDFFSFDSLSGTPAPDVREAQTLENVEVRLKVGEEWDLTKRVTLREGGADVVFDIPADELGEGDYAVRAFIDSRDQIDESNENNNNYEEGTGVRVLKEGQEAWEPPPRPDMVLESLTVDPPEPERGDFMIPIIRLRNDGEADTGEFTVVVTDNSDPYDPRRYHFLVENIEPSDSREIRVDDFPIIAAPNGLFYDIGARIDPNNRIVEEMEGNNFADIELNIPNLDQQNPTCDLLISRVTRLPLSYVREGFYEVNLDSTIQLRVQIIDHDFRALVGERPPEELEGRFHDAERELFDRRAALQQIENVGVRLEVGRRWRRTQDVAMREGSAEMVFEIPTDELGRGEYQLRLVVDYRGDVVESNEDNNIYEWAHNIRVLREGAFQPPPTPDISLESFSVVPENPRVGEEMFPVFRISNRGEGETGPFHVVIENRGVVRRVGEHDQDEFARYEVEVDNLDPGEVRDFRVEEFSLSIAESGEYGVWAYADGFRAVQESDESNNFIIIDVLVGEEGEGGIPPEDIEGVEEPGDGEIVEEEAGAMPPEDVNGSEEEVVVAADDENNEFSNEITARDGLPRLTARVTRENRENLPRLTARVTREARGNLPRLTARVTREARGNLPRLTARVTREAGGNLPRLTARVTRESRENLPRLTARVTREAGGNLPRLTARVTREEAPRPAGPVIRSKIKLILPDEIPIGEEITVVGVLVDLDNNTGALLDDKEHFFCEWWVEPSLGSFREKETGLSKDGQGKWSCKNLLTIKNILGNVDRYMRVDVNLFRK